MSSGTKIAILEPGRENIGRYFTCRLKTQMKEEYPVFQDAGKILVISNIGGKFKALRQALLYCGIINEKGKWIFEDGHLVIFGGSASLEEPALACQWYLYGLEERALRKGGRIHYIASMEEIASLNTSWPYIQPAYARPRSSRSYAVLYDGNNELRRWLLTKNVLEKIGPLIFMNGVVLPELMQANAHLTLLNRKLRRLYSGNPGMTFKTPDPELLQRLSAQYQIDTIISAVPGQDSVITGCEGKWMNVSSILGEDFLETLMIIHNHYYRVNTNGLKERLK